MTTDTTTEITEGDWKTLATTEITHLTDEEKDYLPRAWDEWIARVKRDAAREALASAEDRATQAKARIRHLEATAQITVRKALRAEAERDEWRQTALDERGAALDALEQIKVRDARIKAVEDVLTTVEDGHSTDPVIRGMLPRMVNTDLIRRALDGDA